MYTELSFDLRRVGTCLGQISSVTLVMSVVVYAVTTSQTGYVALAGGIAAGVGVWLVACQLFDLLNLRALYARLQR